MCDDYYSRKIRIFASIMKIRQQYKVREMAGEHVIIMQGRIGADMTKVISLNATSLMLYEALQGKEFGCEDVASLLVENYDVEREIAERDATKWIEKLRECGLIED